MSTALSLSLHADRTLIRAAGRSRRYLRVRITAPEATAGQARPPLQVAFCLDRSGSMGRAKMALARQAADLALGQLGGGDRFTIVTFDDAVEVVTPLASVDERSVATARAKLAQVEARGSTALAEGWLTACGEIGEALAEGAAARCFLLTDGQANVGETNPEVLAGHARELAKRGVRTVSFGLGEGFNEELLQRLAQAGGGHFYFIEEAAQIPAYFASELGEALEVTARDVVLTLRGPGIKCRPLTAYQTEQHGDAATVLLGDLTSGQVVELVVQLELGDGAIGESLTLNVNLRDAGAANLTETVAFVFADHPANDRQPRDVEVDRLVAETFAASARRNAVAHNRAGDYPSAVKALSATAHHIRGYAHADPTLLALAAELEREAQTYATPMTELTRKRAYAQSTSRLKGRDEQGRARKS